ncbi:hypothetical protein D3C72_1743690 [compost metagenome]
MQPAANAHAGNVDIQFKTVPFATLCPHLLSQFSYLFLLLLPINFAEWAKG